MESAKTNSIFFEKYNVTARDLEAYLSEALSRGGDYADLFFEYRIKMAGTLYQAGKVKHLIVSGDNRTRFYNEPLEMKKALVKVGVPDSVITLDYAGLRTLDTIVRCKEVFGQTTITIVTQPFHCYRALFISESYDMNAVAVMAQEPILESNVYFREYFARAKAVLDLYILKTAPTHLGEKEHLSL